jgi:hypothetical protein
LRFPGSLKSGYTGGLYGFDICSRIQCKSSAICCVCLQHLGSTGLFFVAFCPSA